MTQLIVPVANVWKEFVPKTFITGSPANFNLDVSAFVFKEYELRLMLRYNSGVTDNGSLSIIPHNAVNGLISQLKTNNNGFSSLAKVETFAAGDATFNAFGQVGTDATAGFFTEYIMHFYDCQSLVAKPFWYKVLNVVNVLGSVVSCWGEGYDRQTTAFDGVRIAFGAKTLDPTSWYHVMGMT